MGLWRFELRHRPGISDPVGQQARQVLHDFGVRSVDEVHSARLITIELADGLRDEKAAAQRIADELLCDPVAETCLIRREGEPVPVSDAAVTIEVHLRPGVMDNVANSVLIALRDMGIQAASVRTARRYELFRRPPAGEIKRVFEKPIQSRARKEAVRVRPRKPLPHGRGSERIGAFQTPSKRIARLLGNACIEEVVIGAKPIEAPPRPPEYRFACRTVPVRNMDDAALEKLSREGHLFLSPHEMRTIQARFRELGREPTDLELETLAQTWSEHCVHKTLRARVEYRGAPFPDAHRQEGNGKAPARPSCAAAPDAPFLRIYENLLKDTIVRATNELMREGRGPQCLSVFEDNAGVIAFDDTHGIAFKVETHNHPSAIEPYGGAATGIGGCIRDILGCGLGAKPIANTDVFCAAPPTWPVEAVPKGVIHPKTVLQGVVAGVRDYGNRMGIPTVNGAIHFDARYLGNPLVFCGCVGLIPRDRIAKGARPGDAIVLIGGRTGRDGIHGATFSSAELTETHEDEFAHAVQIGNPIEEKKVLDVILQARDWPCETSGTRRHPIPNRQSSIVNRQCLFSAITDCGAGGLSSAVGEMGAETGAEVDLEHVPLKYAGLRHDEIWISEAQERMVLAVPPENVETFLALARSEDVEATVIGRFTETKRLVVRYEGHKVGDLDMAFLHHGLPKVSKTAEWWPEETPRSALHIPHSAIRNPQLLGFVGELKRRLSDPTTASKHWVIRQYDHEVQGGSVVKPLVGRHDGPSDAAVVRPRLDSNRGVAIGCGLAPQWADRDPYWGAVAAIDEALRNVVCVGGNPNKTAILDNFCWPGADDARHLGALVRACQGCYDAAKAYGLPFISGKDSLNNEFAASDADAAMLCDEMERQGDSTPDAWRRRLRERGRLAIPYTLLISAVSVIDDVERCITAAPRVPRARPRTLVAPPSRRCRHRRDACATGLLGRTPKDAARLYFVGSPSADWDDVRLDSLAALHARVARLIREGAVLAAHDCSDGGIVTAVAEMAMAADLDCRYLVAKDGPLSDAFLEPVSGYVVQAADLCRLEKAAALPGILLRPIARLERGGQQPMFQFIDEASGKASASVAIGALRDAWRAPLDW